MSVQPTPDQTNQVQSDSLRAQIFQRLHPHAYLDRFLIEGVRPDGRTPDEWRDVSINVGTPCLLVAYSDGWSSALHNKRSKAERRMSITDVNTC